MILEAQQSAVEEHPDKQFYNLNIDGGAMWARRLIDKMMAEEDERYSTAAAEADEALQRADRAEATVPMRA